MRLICFACGKSVSSEVPEETIVRAVLYCPECIPRVVREDAPSILEAKGKGGEGTGSAS